MKISHPLIFIRSNLNDFLFNTIIKWLPINEFIQYDLLKVFCLDPCYYSILKDRLYFQSSLVVFGNYRDLQFRP